MIGNNDFQFPKYSIGVTSVYSWIQFGDNQHLLNAEVKTDDASKAPVTSTQEAPKVSAVSAQEASTRKHLFILLFPALYLKKAEAR